MNMRRWLPIVLVCLLAGGTAALSQDLAALLEEAERAAPAPVPAPPADDPGRAPAAARPAVVDADASEASRSTQDRRTPLPAAAEALTATSRVKAVFRERYSGALKPADKAALATEILELLKSTSNQADRWALLSEALRLASEGGQVDLAIATAKTLSGEFQVESADMMLTVLKQLSSSAPPAAASRTNDPGPSWSAPMVGTNPHRRRERDESSAGSSMMRMRVRRVQFWVFEF